MPNIDNLPQYRDLPLFEGKDERHACEVFGANDNLGTINLLTAERVRDAAQLVRRGDSFNLDLSLDLTARGSGGGRGAYVHKPTRNCGCGDDSLDTSTSRDRASGMACATSATANSGTTRASRTTIWMRATGSASTTGASAASPGGVC